MISINQEAIRKLNNQNSVTPDSMEEGSGKTHDPVRSEWSLNPIAGSNKAAKICTLTSAVSASTLFPVIPSLQTQWKTVFSRVQGSNQSSVSQGTDTSRERWFWRATSSQEFINSRGRTMRQRP